MEVIYSSEMSVDFQRSADRYILEHKSPKNYLYFIAFYITNSQVTYHYQYCDM
jgi:hypothetical protein